MFHSLLQLNPRYHKIQSNHQILIYTASLKLSTSIPFILFWLLLVPFSNIPILMNFNNHLFAFVSSCCLSEALLVQSICISSGTTSHLCRFSALNAKHQSVSANLLLFVHFCIRALPRSVCFEKTSLHQSIGFCEHIHIRV